MLGFERFSFLVRAQAAARSGLWDTNPSLQGSSINRPLLRHTRPGKAVYWQAEKEDQVFSRVFLLCCRCRPLRNSHNCHPQDKPLDSRQTHILEELLAGFGPGWYFIFHLSSSRCQRTFLYPPPEDPPSRRPAPTPL
ncbi:hypothetical protein WA026_015446 [Henosepilachna vigintioctopunctata]|uniref:Uncharacterized protein n=1 Tax=Henosepilachna vigintioctopunctata TaxID=420089 RepID=A0AAW1UFP2_9CUCU